MHHRQHGSHRRQAAALTSTELKKLVAVCDGETAGLRDRAVLLVGFAASPSGRPPVGPVRSICTGCCPSPTACCGWGLTSRRR
jgi:hypothetical protein